MLKCDDLGGRVLIVADARGSEEFMVTYVNSEEAEEQFQPRRSQRLAFNAQDLKKGQTGET